MKKILSGNEAIARGAYEAGCTVAAAYPGTPSTEILENIGSLYNKEIFSHWACNEKVATEIASGASIGGARSITSMKQVGMNVAADPIFTMGYVGTNGGMVIVSADDPGCHSSQNEQDNRLYAPHAKLGMMEPSDSQECKEYTIAAFELSERFDVPILLRVTTRICHSKSIVELGDRIDFKTKPYERLPDKNIVVPSTARLRHLAREASLILMEEYANDCKYNRAEYNGNNDIGIITSGISYQHAKEVFGEKASYLKLGLTYPMPRKLITEFAEKFKTLYIIEENDPYIENCVRALGFTHCIGKERITIQGELDAHIIKEALFDQKTEEVYQTQLKAPSRVPVLCAGCPHRGFFYALHQYSDKIVPAGDIGCYGLGGNPPLNAIDYSICMGAGLSAPIGFAKALESRGDKRKALGMVGDSTFFHSGITALIDIVSTESNVIACILDNSITAMTGHQDNPGTGKNVMGGVAPAIDILELVLATGIRREMVRVVDPLDFNAVMDALDKAIAVKGPFVIITKRPCVLIKEVAKANAGRSCRINPEKCKGCKACMKIVCPAITFKEGKATIVRSASCTGCGLCAQMCKFGAIEEVNE